MSKETMTTDKIYVGSGKQVKDYDMVNVSINLTKLSKEASDFIFEYDGNKYVKLTIAKMREENQYGKTHSVSVDTFKPEAKKEQDSDGLPF